MTHTIAVGGDTVAYLATDGTRAMELTTVQLGGDVAAGERPQAVVPTGAWQAARPLGAYALVGCIVAPAFAFEGFELAPSGWEPPVRSA